MRGVSLCLQDTSGGTLPPPVAVVAPPLDQGLGHWMREERRRCSSSTTSPTTPSPNTSTLTDYVHSRVYKIIVFCERIPIYTSLLL